MCEPLSDIVETADAARKERSETVTAFVRRMRLQDIQLERDLSDTLTHRSHKP